MNGKNKIQEESVYVRKGEFAIFNQYGIKLDFRDSIEDEEYYKWLDDTIQNIGNLIPGAEIAEKSYARIEPRLNTGVYYDTKDYHLLKSGMVLRTTCNKKTHAFCAFKLSENDQQIRRDHRCIFDGAAKKSIQDAPTSAESIAFVKELLARQDIEHPGRVLEEITGIVSEDLSPALCIEQYRHPFFVWLDKKDALRCSMDRVTTYDLRTPEEKRTKFTFSEIELPIYPHIEDSMMKDSRLYELVEVLSNSIKNKFESRVINDSKYQRAAKIINLL